MTTSVIATPVEITVEGFSFIYENAMTPPLQGESINFQTLEIVTLNVEESTQTVHDLLNSNHKLVKKKIVPVGRDLHFPIFVYEIIKKKSEYFSFDGQKLVSVSLYVTVKNTGIELWLCGINDRPHRNDVDINHLLLGIDIDSLNDSMDIVQLDTIEQLVEVIDQVLDEFERVIERFE